MILNIETKMNKKHRLKDSKTFCMAPWVSINNNPNGDIIPCCIASGEPFGNLYTDTVENIWNNDKFKQLRLDMLNDTPNKVCQACYKADEWGSNSNYRKYWNENYSHKYNELVENTNADGSLDEMKLYRWDFRFNNLCNLACIGCGPQLSSSWVELQKRLSPGSEEFKIYSSRENKEKFINTIKSQAEIVDNIYFAGGEPLMHAEHYEILEELDRLNKLDQVEFMYSTNLTNLHFKDKYIVDYWQKMKKCKIVVSLDEVDPTRLHYIRYPSDFNIITDNLRIIDQTLRSVYKQWSIVPTWNILNVHRMKDIIGYFYNQKLLPYAFYTSVSWEQDMHNIILMHPTHLSMSTATPEWKAYIHTTLNDFEEWYLDTMIPLKTPAVRFFASEILKSNMNKFRNALNEPGEFDNTWIKKMDEVRQTNFAQTFPELKWLV